MALQIDKPARGAVARYWRIHLMSRVYDGRQTGVTVFGYVSKQARDDSPDEPLTILELAADGETRTELYASLKNSLVFSGAVDV